MIELDCRHCGRSLGFCDPDFCIYCYRDYSDDKKERDAKERTFGVPVSDLSSVANEVRQTDV